MYVCVLWRQAVHRLIFFVALCRGIDAEVSLSRHRASTQSSVTEYSDCTILDITNSDNKKFKFKNIKFSFLWLLRKICASFIQ